LKAVGSAVRPEGVALSKPRLRFRPNPADLPFLPSTNVATLIKNRDRHAKSLARGSSVPGVINEPFQPSGQPRIIHKTAAAAQTGRKFPCSTGRCTPRRTLPHDEVRHKTRCPVQRGHNLRHPRLKPFVVVETRCAATLSQTVTAQHSSDNPPRRLECSVVRTHTC